MKYLLAAGASILIRGKTVQPGQVVEVPAGLFAAFSAEVQARLSESVEDADVDVTAYEIAGSDVGGGGLEYTEVTITTGFLVGNGGTYDEAFVLAGPVVIESATIERTDGVSTAVAASIYDGDPALGGENISALIGDPFMGIDASSPVSGPQSEAGGVKSRTCIPLPAGTFYVRVKNDPGFTGNLGGYTLTFKYRPVE